MRKATWFTSVSIIISFRNDLINEFFLFLVDYGNSASVPKEEVLKLDKKLMFEVVVHECILENFPEILDDKANHILNNDLHVENVKMDVLQNIKVARIAGL